MSQCKLFFCAKQAPLPQLETVSTFPQETVARSWSHTAAPLEHPGQRAASTEAETVVP